MAASFHFALGSATYESVGRCLFVGVSAFGIFAAAQLLAKETPALVVSELATSTPEAEGMSAEKLAKVGEIMNGLIEDKKIAGGLVLIAATASWCLRRPTASVTWSESRRGDGHDLPHLLDVKAITSAAALILVDEGKLDLDAPVSKYLPEYAETRVVDGDKARACEIADDGEELFRTPRASRTAMPAAIPPKNVRSDRRAGHAVGPRP